MPLTINARVHQETLWTTNTQRTQFRPAPLLKRGKFVGRLRFEQLQRRIAPLRRALLHHPVYDAVDSLDRLRDFMQIHVFAVWDFMSLVKRLHSEVTVQRLPWMPPASAQIARVANEVVLGEESDLGPEQKPASHIDLYLRAIEAIGADAQVVRTFMQKIERGEQLSIALQELEVAPSITDFVKGTL